MEVGNKKRRYSLRGRAKGRREEKKREGMGGGSENGTKEGQAEEGLLGRRYVLSLLSSQQRWH